MPRNGSAPALGKEREGVNVVFAGDIGDPITTTVRVQHLSRFGIPSTRAAIIAPLCFGEARHA
jgi:hypothetical protein